MAKVLVIEDDFNISELIRMYLEKNGFSVRCSADGGAGVRDFAAFNPDIVLLDIMLPVMDGWHVCADIRKTSKVPIIMLTAKDEVFDKVSGLEMGADDYIAKPFNPLELLARVKSQLRRYTVLGSQTKTDKEGIYTVGGLTLDDKEKSVTLDGETVRLTPIEYGILYLLIRNPGRVFSIDEIYERVWGEDSMGQGSTVTVHIRRIREKIEINPGEPKYIKVVWGVGYKIEKLDGAPSG